MDNSTIAEIVKRKFANIHKFLAKHDMQMVLDANCYGFMVLPKGVELHDTWYARNNQQPKELKNPSAVRVNPEDINKMVIDGVKLNLDMSDVVGNYVCYHKSEIDVYADPALIKKMGARVSE